MDNFVKGTIDFVIAILIGLAVLIVFAVKEENNWKDECVSRGGRFESTNNVTIVGKTTVVDTTWFCLTEDGRILDVE